MMGFCPHFLSEYFPIAGVPDLNCVIFIVFVAFSFIFLSFWIGYRRGCTLVVRLVGSVLNRVFTFWPRWPYTHTTVVTGLASVGAFLLFVPYTDELIVNITAFYATILFLQEIFRKEVPLLGVRFKRSRSTIASDSTLVDVDDSDSNAELVKQLIEIENFGDATADNIQAKYRVISSTGGIVQDWKSADEFKNENWTVEPNQKVQKEIPTALVKEYSEQKYYVEMKLTPNIRSGHLMIWNLNLAKPDST